MWTADSSKVENGTSRAAPEKLSIQFSPDDLQTLPCSTLYLRDKEQGAPKRIMETFHVMQCHIVHGKTVVADKADAGALPLIENGMKRRNMKEIKASQW